MSVSRTDFYINSLENGITIEKIKDLISYVIPLAENSNSSAPGSGLSITGIDIGATEQPQIFTNGVGIGTLTPTVALDVVGNIKITDNLESSNSFSVINVIESTEFSALKIDNYNKIFLVGSESLPYKLGINNSEPSTALDVVGDVIVRNSNYPNGFFHINQSERMAYFGDFNFQFDGVFIDLNDGSGEIRFWAKDWDNSSPTTQFNGNGSGYLSYNSVLWDSDGNFEAASLRSDTIISLNNGTQIQPGTVDGNVGGNKGIALICSVQYELKWEAGRLFILESNGSTIREVKYTFNNTPDVSDDVTKGYQVGSRWILDNGTTYVCLDATEATAIWTMEAKASRINLPYNEALELSSSSRIIAGQQYLITDKADLGIIVTGSQDPTKFETSAIGGFLNADYQNIGNYENIQNITGFSKQDNYGIWTPATANSLINGDIFIFNNDIWQVTADGDIDRSGAGDPISDSGPYYRFLKNNFLTERVGYIQEWDNIEYDFDDDNILWRSDKRGNKINNYSISYFQFGNNSQVNIRVNKSCFINNLNSTGNISDINISNNCGVDISNSNGNYYSLDFSNGYYIIVLNSDITHSNNIYSNSFEFNFDANTTYQSKELSNSYSTFDADYDCTSTDTIDLININYAGILKLFTTSGSYPEIKNIFNASLKNIKVIPRILPGSNDIKFMNNNGNIIINTRDLNGDNWNMAIDSGRSLYHTAEFQELEINAESEIVWFLVNGVYMIKLE